MGSKAVASLDEWLVQADEVLREQREQGLSPSTALSWDAGTVKVAIALSDFLAALEGVLTALCRRPGRWILIAEDAARPARFWQALAYEDGSLVVETVSNHYLEGDDRLTSSQEEALVSIGWDRPDPPRWPNWSWVEPTTSPAVDEAAVMAAATLRRVFGLENGDELVVKLFSSPRRGRTPATPECVEAADVDDVPAEAGRRFFVPLHPDRCPAELTTLDDALFSGVAGSPVSVGKLIDPGGGPDEEDSE